MPECAYRFEVLVFSGPGPQPSVAESDLQPVSGIPAGKLLEITSDLGTFVRMDGAFTATADGQLVIQTNHEAEVFKRAAELIQLIADTGVIGHLWLRTADGRLRYLGEAHGPIEYDAAAEKQR